MNQQQNKNKEIDQRQPQIGFRELAKNRIEEKQNHDDGQEDADKAKMHENLNEAVVACDDPHLGMNGDLIVSI